MLGIGVEHLGKTSLARCLHQHIGKEQRERLVADQIARAPDRMTEAKRLLLAGEARAPRTRQIVGEGLKLGGLAARGKNLLEFELPVEMILDDALVAAGDKNEVLDARLPRLVDDMLNERPVDHGQHLLRHRLGRRQEAGAQPCHRKHRLADASSHPILVRASLAKWNRLDRQS